ncbi:hypothetical protein QQM79_20100 [Marinobacteraceae bacterium S3BR75-40.1]
MTFIRSWAGLLLSSLACLPAASWSGAYLNTFEPLATADPESDTLTLVVKLGCDQGEQYRLRVTANQRDSGAVAEGHVSGICKGQRKTGTFQTIPVAVQTIGDARFDPSKGLTAAGLVKTSSRAKHSKGNTDVHQWIPPFELSLQ